MHPILRKLFTNTESDAFRLLQKQVDVSKSVQNSTSDNDNCDLTPDEYEQSGQLIPIDYGLSLRLAVQEHKQSEQKSPITEVDNISPLTELVNPELIDYYQKLIETLEAKTKVSKDHPEREFIDIEHETIAKEIEQWIGKLIKETEAKRGSNLAQGDIYELEALTWFHFDSLITSINVKSLKQDIDEFCKSSRFDELSVEDQKQEKAELVDDLIKRYPLKKDELEILVDLLTSKTDEKGLFEILRKIWNQYELGTKKGTISKIILNHLVSTGVLSTFPLLFQYGINFVTGGFVVGNPIGAYCDLKAQTKSAELMNHVEQKINERICKSLFFRRYEFTQETSLGKLFMVVENGKRSTINLLSESISQLVPQSAGIGTSFGCLLLINPILAGINFLSIPASLLIQRSYNKKISPIHRAQIKQGEKLATQLAELKAGMQEILTSSHIPEVATSFKDKMDEVDKLSLQKLIYQIKMRFAGYFIFKASSAASLGAGLVLYHLEQISEKAAFSNLFYAGSLSDPFKNLIDMYFTRFADYIRDIERMEEVLGEADTLDPPNGEKEKMRRPVSELASHDISIKDLRFKNILNGVNIDIHDGEFVTIVGPSGSGKTTLLRNISGLYEPENGSVTVGGIPINGIKKYGDESIYSIMSYCNQDPQIFQEMTLRENLMLWSNKKVDDAYLKQVLEELDLHKFTDKLDEKVNHFSGGEKVRVGVARTLIKGAKIMLLDEPTASLDSQASLEVRKILRRIHERYPETTIICVTHDEKLIEDSLVVGRSINLGNNSN